MPFTLKKDAEGKPVIKDGKPVYLNTDTNAELEVDVDKLFTDNSNLRHEAETHRKAKETAETALKAFEGVNATTVKADLAELAKLKTDGAQGGGKTKPPTQEELDKLVDERFQAKLGEIQGQLDAEKTARTAAETARDDFKGKYQGLSLETEYTKAAAKVGIRPEAMDDGLRYVSTAFKVEDDGIPRKRDVNGKVVPGTDPSKPLSIEEELRGVTAKDKRIWLQPAKGTEHLQIPGAPGVDMSGMGTTELFALGFQQTSGQT